MLGINFSGVFFLLSELNTLALKANYLNNDAKLKEKEE